MKLVGRIPVEPLDDERLTNIERRIVAGAADAAAAGLPLARSRIGLVLAFAVVCVIVLGAGVVGYKLRGGTDPAQVAETPPLKVHSDGERATFDIGDARIATDPATDLVITRPDDGVMVTMAHGKVELEVDKRGNRGPLIVRAGDTDVVVVGTKFSVDYDGKSEVDVRVTEGVVRVVHQKLETRVAAGNAWSTHVGLVALADTNRAPSKKLDATPRNTDDIAIDIGKAPDVGLHDRVARVPDARVPNNTTGASSGSAARSTPKHQPTLDRLDDANLDLKKGIRNAAVALPLDVGTTDPTAALAKYRSIIIEKTGDQASAAFYSIAYVQYMKLGRESDALATLERYVQRFHGGSEYLPALWLRVRITCLRPKIESDCRRAAYAYVEAAGATTDQGQIADRLKTQP